MTDEVRLRNPYHQAAQQRSADLMGMYLFLASEIMLFGGLLAAVLALRIEHPHAVSSAAQHLKIWLGTANTVILLTSSLAVAVAVAAARFGRAALSATLFAAAGMLGVIFLGIKALEYQKEYSEGLMPFLGNARPLKDNAEFLFLNLYYVATGLHALHMTIGIAAIWTAAWRIFRRHIPVPGRAIAAEVTGLYWHFVDVVWVFLFPVFYLAR
ncbi:cytochrome c oxidase subunit 3 [Pacificimonas flava]|uniref:Cytochrome c oxidase polypeptide III n=1 Tax=Pacificimonas flava TaxID=1234595 RepID=M2U8Y7_9SPHN|nr:cytochrome c oxidase subunit 3 [Pacificimonas flava]EMD84453.1 Cytochrome c oxidase polypeptide III [Pacificimonas flava]MBB5279675.1 cytochrome c oxidase subunit 3 [Pacificimonas flava]